MINRMMQKVGVYYYLFPTYKQGRKVLWDGIDRDGFRFLDHFPKELIDGQVNNQEMKIRLKNGSLFQIVGTDDYDSVMGTNPIGTIWSEYSLQNPVVWDYFRPILRENKGWALFIYTPRGHNHGWRLMKTARRMAKKNKGWFCEVLPITKTGVLTEEDIQQERDEGMDEDLIQQEYYCSFEGAMQGAYYGRYLAKARKEKRVGVVPYETSLKVHTAWDLGIGDATAIWFFQQSGYQVRLIDYYEAQGEGLSHYAKILQDKGYIYGDHFSPHDIEVRELGTGKSRLEVARNLGINFTVVPKLPVEEGIDAVRRMFNKCWFDEEKCQQGLDALESYCKEYDEKRREYKNKPYHDWTSHASDAFRYLALGRKEAIVNPHESTKDPEIEEMERERAWREGLDEFNPTNPFGTV